MVKIVNLRQERKRKARQRDEAKAAENRQSFGTPKALRELAAARRNLAERVVDGAKRQRDDDVT